jgi:phage terminase large subunit-like protein
MSKNSRADESVLNLATTNGASLRTTIPSWIVAKFELKKSDKFRWHILHEKDTEYIAIQVIKAKSIGEELGIK